MNDVNAAGSQYLNLLLIVNIEVISNLHVSCGDVRNNLKLCMARRSLDMKREVLIVVMGA